MSVTTAEIERELAGFLTTAYSGLIREYVLFTAAMLASCAVIPAFILWQLCRRDRRRVKKGEPCRAYTHRGTAPLVIHSMVMLLMPALAVRELYYSLYPVKRAELIIPCILLILLAVPAAVGLIRLRPLGLLLSGAFALGFAAFIQYKYMLGVAADIGDMGKLDSVGQYTLYIADGYLTAVCMAAGFAAASSLALLTAYYYRRRFLFMPGMLRVPVCEHCGQVIGTGDFFCTCCGRRLLVRPVKQVIESLDRKPFCGKCGSFINKSLCVKCSGTARDVAKKTVRESAGEIKRKLLWAAAALLVAAVLAPLGSGGRVIGIQSGSGRVNDAFAQRLEGLKNEPGLALDAEWLEGFESAAGALYQSDARWLAVERRKVPSNCLGFFAVYSDASFRQMKMLEQSVETVRKTARGELEEDEIRTELEGLYNELAMTNRLQADAMQYYGTVSPKWDWAGIFCYLCLDGLLTLLPLGDTRWISVIILVCCAAMLTYMLKRSDRRLKGMIEDIISSSKASKGHSAAYKRQQRTAALAAAGVVLAIAGAVVLTPGGEPADGREYLFAAKAAASGYAVDISKTLWELCSGKAMMGEDTMGTLRELIQAQIAADQAVIDYDMQGLEEYQALHSGLISLCRDDIGALERIMDSIEKGEAPSRELIKNYEALRGENYLWIIGELPQQLARLNVEIALDV